MNKEKQLKKNKIQKREVESFLSFISKKAQLLDWLLLGGICLIGYIFVKYYYPYPATMSDSGGYVVNAVQDRFSFYRPFGYSYFLQFMHSISSSINTIFIVQILLYFISTTFFAFTIKYFFIPNKKYIWYILLVFLSFSPLAFFMANSIMSDMYFSSMIYFMLVGFIFIIIKKSWIGFAIFSISLFCSLHIRYSAMIFPFLLIPFLFLIKGNIKWVYIVTPIFLFFIFHAQIKRDMQQTTGFDQFSTGFDGWQLANNAMHIIPFIDLPAEKIENPNIKELHKFVIPFKSKILENTKNGSITSAAFLWDNKLPLKQYLFRSIQESYQSYPKTWIFLGSGLYRDYGSYLMLHYPLQFMRYYFLPNSLNMVYPKNAGILNKYVPLNGQKDIVNWYNLSENKDLNCKEDIYNKFLANWISISHIFIWIIIATIGIISIINRKRIKFNRQEKIVFWGLFVFGGIYYASTIFASPIELRYWLPMSCIQFSFCYILLNKFIKHKPFKRSLTKENGENR